MSQPDIDYRPDTIPMPTSRCQHIRCKGMAVYGALYRIPENEMYRTNNFWCERTQRSLGPDAGLVLLSKCVPSRDCYDAL